MKTSEIAAIPFGWGSALRHRKIFHPAGIVAAGTLERIAPAQTGVPLGSGPVTARVSKAIGLPGSLPDITGLAWRMSTEGHRSWDLLLASVAGGALSRVLLRPIGSWSEATFSTLMPLKVDGAAWWVRARITTPIADRGLSLDVIARLVADGGLSVLVEQARGAADFQPLAQLTLDELTPREMSFDPIRNDAPGVELMPGWLTDLRRAAYRRSREGRAGE